MPSDRKLRVFISSTSDLKDERESIRVPTNSMEAYRYEEDRPRKQSPRDRLKEVLKSTDAFVAILGGRYGSLYPDCKEDRAIVEWEFDTARAQRTTELFTFVKAGLQPEEVEREQKIFLDKLSDFKKGIWLKPFTSASELQVQVLEALGDWLTYYWLRYHEREKLDDAARRRAIRRLAPPMVLAFGIMGLVTSLFAGWSTQGALIFLCVVFALVILATMIIGDR